MGESTLGMLGTYIRAQRELANMSLRQLAGVSNVSNAYLSQIERGLHQPSLKVLRAISEALDISVETLLAQAGMLGGTQTPERSATSVEQAVIADPQLSDDEKQILLGVYRNFQRRHAEASSDPG